MQGASSSYFPSPPPQPYYQSLYHIQPLAPQDHELKRQYLKLLPSQQIIEICLTFDVHVPPYIKSTVWPQDIHAAIANLVKPNVDGDASTSQQKDNDKPPEPIMASLDNSAGEFSTPQPSSSNRESYTTEREPSEKPANSCVPVTTTASSPPAPAPATPAVPLIQPQPPYPHQPYGYPQHPPAAYPHAPYYPLPPGYPSYPHYPHYSPPVLNGYHPPPPPPPPSHPGYHSPAIPIFPTPHVPQPPTHHEQGSDDLPSYEEMIVEALQESTDAEGCAPKDLFAWMAARYPLQSNFRPSASQALQKAFKRGRLEKGDNGKYRLSATWEGGSTSRRTTRRPQTQSQSGMGNTTGPPFTHAPLIHHHQQNAHPSPYPGQLPYTYPYGGPVPPGYPGYPAQPQPHMQPPQSQVALSGVAGTTTNTSDKPASGVVSASDVDKDTYEAAQSILKAINFGDLYQIASASGGNKPDTVSVDQLTSLLVQAQNALSPPGGQMDAVLQATSPVVPLPTLSASAGVAVAVPSTSEAQTNLRAELQAQLVLLAAQLAELSQENEESILQPSRQSQVIPTSVTGLQLRSLENYRQPQSVASTNFDPPIMGALSPPDVTSPEQSAQTQLSVPPLQPQPDAHEARPTTSLPPTRQDNTPIDPLLQRQESTMEGLSLQASPGNCPSGQKPPSPILLSKPMPLVVSQPQSQPLPPPPPFPVAADTTTAPVAVPQSTAIALEAMPEPEGNIGTATLTDEEMDSNDDDMEAVA